MKYSIQLQAKQNFKTNKQKRKPKQIKILNFVLMPEVNERKVYSNTEIHKIKYSIQLQAKQNYKTNKQKRKPLPSVQTDVRTIAQTTMAKKGFKANRHKKFNSWAE